MIATINFFSQKQIQNIVGSCENPIYIISNKILDHWANIFIKSLKVLPYSGIIRYAMKANPHATILKNFNKKNIYMDASSYYEVLKALKAGIPGEHISLTSQELPPTQKEFAFCIKKGIHFNATSIHQLKKFCKLFPGKNCGIRINPGVGSGYNNKLTTGGVSAGFGIWYEYLDEVKKCIEPTQNKIISIHTHIGSGTEIKEWTFALKTTLSFVQKFPDVTFINIGGGFKARYTTKETDTDIHQVMKTLGKELELFYKKTKRKLKLEIEPGRLLVVHAGILVSKIIDITDTGKKGFTFLKINTGMTEIVRPSLYGAQHELVVVPQIKKKVPNIKKYVVIGHCCESGDCLTVKKDTPEEIEPIYLEEAHIDDLLIIKDTGAYCYTMSIVGYNSFPPAKIIFV